MNFAETQLGNFSRGNRSVPGNEFDDAVRELVRALKKHPAILILIPLVTTTLAIIYIVFRQQTFQATATLYIDPARSNVLATQEVTALQAIDSSVVDSAVEIIKSDVISRDVVRSMHLAQDKEFTEATGLARISQIVRKPFSTPRGDAAAQAEAAAFDKLQNSLDVRRLGATYVVEVKIASREPDKAAEIANSLVDAYLSNELNVNLDVAKRAASWLEARTSQLREKLITADEEVQQYRSENALVDTIGKLPADQQLSELITKLSESRSDSTAARVQADHAGVLIAQGDFDSVAIMAPPDSSTRKARDNAIELERREKEVSDQAGKQNKLTIDAHAEAMVGRAQLEAEVRKYHEGLVREADSKAATVSQLETSQQILTANQMRVSERSIHLRELQRNAASVRKLYETFLGRFKEVGQQETFPMQDVRVIARATAPINPSNFSGAIIAGAAMGVGLLLGLIFSILKERFNPSITDEEDAESATGLRVLADCQFARVAAYHAHPSAPIVQKFLHLRTELSTYLTDKDRVIGITGGGEVGSSAALQIALCYAAAGDQVLLIDCDLTNPSLSLALCPEEKLGLPDVLAAREPWQNVTTTGVDERLAFISANTTIENAFSLELFARSTFKILIDEASEHFDVILLNLPPLSAVAELQVTGRVVRAFVLILCAGETSRNVLRNLLGRLPEVRDRLVGIVFNRSPSEIRKAKFIRAREASPEAVKSAA